jgi:hypothetical protein
MLGLSVGLYGSFSALMLNTSNHVVNVEGDPANPSCLDTVSTCMVEFGVPNWSAGAGLALRYDLSWLLSWPESYVRVDGEFQMGTGSSSSLTAIPISLSFEKGFTLGKAFGLFVGLGGGVTAPCGHGLGRLGRHDHRTPDAVCHADWSLGPVGIRVALESTLRPSSRRRRSHPLWRSVLRNGRPAGRRVGLRRSRRLTVLGSRTLGRFRILLSASTRSPHRRTSRASNIIG